jgi:hypothetical protein
MSYHRKYECDNCGVDGDLQIDFGVKAPEVCLCPNCGVDGARVIPIKRNVVKPAPSILIRDQFPHIGEPITISTLPQTPIVIPSYYTSNADTAATEIIRLAEAESQVG